MGATTQVGRSAITAWVAQSLRFTGFPSADAEVSADSWWKDVAGEPPETQVAQARVGRGEWRGPWHGASLVLQVQPGRLDWRLEPSALDEARGPEFQAIGSLEERLGEFQKLIGWWVPMSPPLERIAFGAVALLPVDDRVEGYVRLADYLPAVQLDPEGSSDFSYRINRPRPSGTGIAGLQINRLSTWSVQSGELHQVMIASGMPAKVSRTALGFACIVDLDINTTADFDGRFEGDRTTEVFGELVDLGREILLEGDVP